MVRPSLDILMNHVDSKYTLVSLAAKRAREMMANNELTEQDKAVTAALNDIAKGNTGFVRIREGVK